ncbi:MAG: hypothetical protein ACLTKI_02050, partial [Lachnospiraceae bacterium]
CCPLYTEGSIGLILYMFISLGKQGDERRKMIVEKASSQSFWIIVCYLLLCIVEQVIKVLWKIDLVQKEINPFVLLTVTSMVYAAALFYNKRKYGD